MVNDSHVTLVRTGDGSFTLYLPDYDEHMHSLSGAYEEALLKHVYPSGILQREEASLQVLDVGFGLGYNILALLVELERAGYRGSLRVISLEKDRSLMTALASIRFNDDRGRLYASVQEAYIRGSHRDGAISIDVLFGDARKTIQSLHDDSFDAVFFDPFSPSRNPELWSVEFFREIYRRMTTRSVLTTYSSAPQVRAAFLEAGFIIGRGPSVGGKREGTLASKGSAIAPLPEGDMELLRKNVRAVPYRDQNLAADRETIRGRRSDEIRLRRSETRER